jgi:hypothetical protein
MKYAPVLIITLNREEHLRRCITSLQKNSYAKYTDLYIGLDYPPNKKYEEGYWKVKKYLHSGISGFNSVNIVEQKSNKGATGNSLAIKRLAYEKHDRIITTEDDNEFSPNYLEYMDRCLEKYENDRSVLAISGYKYPIDTSEIDGNVFFCNSYFSAFGYAIWRDKDIELRKQLNGELFEQIFKNKKFMSELRKISYNQYANMVKGMLGYTPDLYRNGKLRQIDLSIAIYMILKNMKMVYPKESMVRNWGFDGSGVNCGEIIYDDKKVLNHRNFDYRIQYIDLNNEFLDVRETKNTSFEDTNQKLDKFFSISKKELLRTDMAYILSQIIGLNLMRKVVGDRTLFE